MFKPFSNDTDVLNINGDALSITNGTARITLAGDLAITRDKTGLATALALQQAVDAIVRDLQQDPALPANRRDEPAAPSGRADNPFI